MTGQIDVDPDALHEHATAVRNCMSQISGATSDAGNTLDLQAFGVACVEPAQILQIWIQSADSFIKKAVDAGNEVAESIRQMADAYLLNEDEHSKVFRSIHDGLG